MQDGEQWLIIMMYRLMFTQHSPGHCAATNYRAAGPELTVFSTDFSLCSRYFRESMSADTPMMVPSTVS